MKRKALFKFYFAADKLNGALDRIIAAAALHCGETTAESAAQRISEIIHEKNSQDSYTHHNLPTTK